MSKSLMNKLYLKKRLYGLKMQEGSNLVQHINIFNQIITDLVRVDMKIEDEDKTIILFYSLSPSYEYLVTTLTYEKQFISLKEITTALLALNQQKQNASKESQGEGLVVRKNLEHGRR